MRTIRTKVYQFSELSKAAKLKAIEWYRNGLSDDDSILFGFEEHCQEEAEKLGFNDITLRYSLSSCQGDGLSFKCTDFDVDKFIPESIPDDKKLLRKVLAANLQFTVNSNNGHYAYASKGDCDLILDTNKDYPNIQKIVDTMLIKLENKYMRLCKELEKTGYEWIDYQYQDDTIIENIEANEYEFKADGTRF